MAASAVFDSLFGAGVDAGHAVDAVAGPGGDTLVADFDVYSGANLLTETALVAGFSTVEGLVFDEKAVEIGIFWQIFL